MAKLTGNPVAHLTEYELRHLVEHLYHSGRHNELYALVEHRPWYEAKCAIDFTRGTFVQDVELAIGCAESQGVKGLPRVMAYSLLAATVRSWTEVMPIQALRALMLAGDTEQALLCAGLCSRPGMQAEAYWQIGDELAKQGNLETAGTALQRALSRTECVTDDCERSRILSTLAQSLVRTDLIDDGRCTARMAVTVADRIDHHIPRALALAEAACALLQAGLNDEAEHVAQSALHCFRRYNCSRLKVLVLLVQDAFSAASAFAPIYHCSEALCKIARVFAQVGDFQRALSVADTIRIPGLPFRALVFTEVAERMWQVGRASEAHKLVQRVLSYAKWRTFQLLSEVYLLPLVRVLAEMGEVEQACPIVRPRWLGRGDGTMQTKASVALAESGHLGEACELAHHALVATRGDLWLRLNMWLVPALYRSEYAHNLAMIAQVLARAGEKREAEQIARQALATAIEIENPLYRAIAFGDVAVALAQGGLSEPARQAARLAVNASDGSPYWRTHHVLLLPGLAQALAHAGEIESARVVARHLELPPSAQRIPVDPYRGALHLDRVIGLVNVAQALAQTGDLEASLTVARAIRGMPWWVSQRVRALCLIGSEMTRQGRVKEAHRVLRRAQSIASRLPSPPRFRRGTFLEDPELLAEALVELGETRKALNTLAISCEWESDDYTWALAEIVQVIASMSSVEEARQLAQYCANTYSKVENVEGRWMSLVGAAHAFAQLGDLDKAGKLIHHALMAMDKAKPIPRQGLFRLAQALTEVGEVERALEIAEQLTSIEQRDELLSGVMKALGLDGNIDEALVIAQRIADPTDRADALAIVAERMYTSNPHDRLKYVQFAQSVLRNARSEDRQSAARHVAALLPGLGFFGRDAVVAVWQHIRAAEQVLNLDMDLDDKQVFGSDNVPRASSMQPNTPTLRGFIGAVFRRLYVLVGIAVGWLSGYVGWMVFTLIVDIRRQRFQLDELSGLASNPF